jgi:glycosyltransferase involved in cell wall biosynthesis
MLMKVSVIVPVYNVEKYLRSCVNSILNQTLRDIEIILVDDGSPDASGAICDEFVNSDQRVKVIHKKNAGVGAARNDGLAIAQGDWVIFGDSDDWFESDALEKLVSEGEKTKADVIFGDVYLVENGIKKKVTFYKDEFVCNDTELKKKLIAADFSRAYCYNPPETGSAFGYGGPWNKLVRRNLMTENNLRFDTTVKGIFDDLIYTAYIFTYAKTITYRHTMVYDYRHVVASITRTYKPAFLDINKAIFVSWENYIERFGYDKELQKPYYANVIRRFCQLLGLYFFNEKNNTSFTKQLNELKRVIAEEPYASAIRLAEPNGFHSKADRLICSAARTGSPMIIYLAYRIVQATRG